MGHYALETVAPLTSVIKDICDDLQDDSRPIMGALIRMVLFAGTLFTLTGTAHAGIPPLNATCGDGVQIHADEGGPLYINGKESPLTPLHENSYEARQGDITV